MEILDLKFAGVSLWWWFGIAAICLFLGNAYNATQARSWTTWPEENNSRLRKKPAKSRPGKTSLAAGDRAASAARSSFNRFALLFS
jgi:hypothetical protein